jgi:hypothetical protein
VEALARFSHALRRFVIVSVQGLDGSWQPEMRRRRGRQVRHRQHCRTRFERLRRTGKSSEKLQGIVDQVKDLTLLEASQLVKMMEETFGVSAAAAAVAAARLRARAAAAPAVREGRVRRNAHGYGRSCEEDRDHQKWFARSPRLD